MSDSASAKLRLRLAEAEAAYHRLVLGESVTVMQHRAGEQGTNVTYQPGQEAVLQRYIASLKRQIGDIPQRRAMRIVF